MAEEGPAEVPQGPQLPDFGTMADALTTVGNEVRTIRDQVVLAPNLPLAIAGGAAPLQILNQINQHLGRIEERLGEMDERLGEMDERFDEMNERFDDVDEHLDRIDEYFDGIDERLGQIAGRLDQV